MNSIAIRVALPILLIALALASPHAQFTDAGGKLRVALVKQPFVPNGTSTGPTTMADGGIQPALAGLGATVRINEVKLTAEQEPEYGGWKRLGFALGHLGRIVAANAREGYFNVGLLGTCPSMPGMVTSTVVRRGRYVSTARTPSIPLPAETVENPADSRTSERMRRISGSSSMMTAVLSSSSGVLMGACGLSRASAADHPRARRPQLRRSARWRGAPDATHPSSAAADRTGASAGAGMPSSRSTTRDRAGSSTTPSRSGARSARPPGRRCAPRV